MANLHPSSHQVEREAGTLRATPGNQGIELHNGEQAVLAELDPRHYRDGKADHPWLIHDPERDTWHLFAAALDAGQPTELAACVAWWTEQPDGSWKSRPPLFSPGRFSRLRYPALFAENGNWYLLYTVELAGQTPFVLTDMYQPEGTLYAIGYHGLTGTYRPPVDEVLLGGARTPEAGRIRDLRPLQVDDQRYALYDLDTQPAPDDEPAQSAKLRRQLPLVVDPAGELAITCAAEWDDPGNPVPVEPSLLTDYQGQAVHWLERTLRLGAVSLEVGLDHGWQAGLVIAGDRESNAGLVICFDARYACLMLKDLASERILDRRTWFPAKPQQELRVILPDPLTIEIYLDGNLMLHQVRLRRSGQQIGLYVNRARATFGACHLNPRPQSE